MLIPLAERISPNQRVRAILLTPNKTLLFIKRLKPNKPQAYWVAPGGGVEAYDLTLHDALRRELREELGAKIEIIEESFVLRHNKADKELEEHFFICRLLAYDLSLRDGPEFTDPSRGIYAPDEVALTREALENIYLKTEELQEWLLNHLEYLRKL